jgi:hypothetical protein
MVLNCTACHLVTSISGQIQNSDDGNIRTDYGAHEHEVFGPTLGHLQGSALQGTYRGEQEEMPTAPILFVIQTLLL